MKKTKDHAWNHQNQTYHYHEVHVHHYYPVHHMELVFTAPGLVEKGLLVDAWAVNTPAVVVPVVVFYGPVP